MSAQEKSGSPPKKGESKSPEKNKKLHTRDEEDQEETEKKVR